MPVTYIYTLSDPRTNQVRYIGKSVNPKVRYLRHLRDRINTHCSRWIAELINRGLKPVMQVIAEVPEGEDWQVVERAWIEWGRIAGWNLTNLTAGGDGSLGLPQSDEARRKRSESQKGRVFTEEHRRNISEARRNSPLVIEHCRQLTVEQRGKEVGVRTPETREKIAAWHRGKVVSEETRAKLSELALNRTDEHRQRLREAQQARRERERLERESNNGTD